MNAFSSPPGDGARLSGKIKWFNRSKGFGFIVPNDGSGDVFLPLAVLERAGYSEAPDGASITIEWVQGPKGRAATQIVSLDASTAAPRPQRESRGPRREDEAMGPTETVDGVVKWYDGARGFGFILPNDGGKDVFIHVTCLRRSGLEELQPGQTVRMEVAEARRGREATSVQLVS
jgi:CspA family cold shock protein